MQGMQASSSALDKKVLCARQEQAAQMSGFREPLFEDVRAALSFGFRMHDAQVLSFAQAYDGAPTYGAKVVLTQFEWIAQGALIRRVIQENFRDIELALVLADYGAGRYRINGVEAFAEEFARASSNPYLMRQAVRRHFGLSDKTVGAVAKVAAVPKRTVERVFSRLRDDIGQMQDNLKPRLDLLFVYPGICERL